MKLALPLAASLLVAAPAHANPWWQAGPEDRVALDVPADIALGVAGVAAIVVPELLKSTLAPKHCVNCDGLDNSGLPGDPLNGPGTLNGVDAFFHDQLTGAVFERKTADTVSTVLVGAAVVGSLGGAFLSTGPHGSPGAGGRAAIIVAESTALALGVVQGTKFFVARKRPFVRFGHGTDGSSSDTGTTYDVTNDDSHLSFPSGHTAFATSASVSLAMTATLEDSRAAPVLWAGAAVVSVGTGALRIIAEKHYFTDVATGAAIGAVCGVVLPYLHQRGGALAKSVSVSAAPGMATVAWAGAF